jgi:hypothetical protein
MDDRGSIPGRDRQFFSSPPRPNQPPIPWAQRALSLGLNLPGRQADRSPPTGADVKNARGYTSTPLYIFMACCLDFTKIYVFTFACYRIPTLKRFMILYLQERKVQFPCR